MSTVVEERVNLDEEEDEDQEDEDEEEDPLTQLTQELKAKNKDKGLTLASAAASSGYGSQSTPTDSSCCSDSVESQPHAEAGDADQEQLPEDKGQDILSEGDAEEINGNEEPERDAQLPATSEQKELTSGHPVTMPEWLVVGESIRTVPDSKTGIIGFIGSTRFSAGLWIGVILDTPMGKNDGSVDGVVYFTCKPRYGIFVRPDKLRLDIRGRSLRKATGSSSSLNVNSTKAR